VNNVLKILVSIRLNFWLIVVNTQKKDVYRGKLIIILFIVKFVRESIILLKKDA